MMSFTTLPLRLFSGAVLLLMPALPAKRYPLTPEQLAWQPYRKDQVLRFGHAQDAYVRTYKVKSVRSKFVKDGPNPGQFETLLVVVQRTDTTAKPFDALELELFASDEQEGAASLKVYAGWDNYGSSMPVEKILQGITPAREYTRSTMGRVGSSEVEVIADESAELVPSYTLGGKTYPQVVRIDNRLDPTKQRLRYTFRHLYFSRALGVVGFEGTTGGEWYRVD